MKIKSDGSATVLKREQTLNHVYNPTQHYKKAGVKYTSDGFTPRNSLKTQKVGFW